MSRGLKPGDLYSTFQPKLLYDSTNNMNSMQSSASVYDCKLYERHFRLLHEIINCSAILTLRGCIQLGARTSPRSLLLHLRNEHEYGQQSVLFPFPQTFAPNTGQPHLPTNLLHPSGNSTHFCGSTSVHSKKVFSDILNHVKRAV